MIHAEMKETCRLYDVDFVIFDVDSTLSTIEGIDELARMKGVANQTELLTKKAMNGELAFDQVYFERFRIIQPTYQEVKSLGKLYRQTITPGTKETIDHLQRNGVQVFVVTGGFNPAIKMLTRTLQIPDTHVFANKIFDKKKNFRHRAPLDKQQVVRCLLHQFHMARGRIARSKVIGDGMADLQAGIVTNGFICFAGIEARPNVIDKAEHVVFEKDLRGILPYL